MATKNPRLEELARKYHELKAVHRYALCQAAEANQNERFSYTARLLLETDTPADIRALKAYIDQQVAC